MTQLGFAGRLARVSARRPWFVIGAWLVRFAVLGYPAPGIGDVLTAEFVITNDPESSRADRLLEKRLRGAERATELVIAGSTAATVDDHRFENFATDLLPQLRELGGTVETATSYFETHDENHVSSGRDKTLLPVMIADDEGETADNVGSLVDVVEEANARLKELRANASPPVGHSGR